MNIMQKYCIYRHIYVRYAKIAQNSAYLIHIAEIILKYEKYVKLLLSFYL